MGTARVGYSWCAAGGNPTQGGCFRLVYPGVCPSAPLPLRMAREAIWGRASGRDSKMTRRTPRGAEGWGLSGGRTEGRTQVRRATALGGKGDLGGRGRRGGARGGEQGGCGLESGGGSACPGEAHR